MRIRKKKWAVPELNDCNYYIKDPAAQKGVWANCFNEKQELHLDLGCGKGVFLADIALDTPQINYVGIDISLDILGVARRNIEDRFGESEPGNVRIGAYDIGKLAEIFSNRDNVKKIYINFCNPWPKARCHKKRLTHPDFLQVYAQILSDDGEIWFKTDNEDLFLASERYFKESGFHVTFLTRDLHSEDGIRNILTEHEVMYTLEGITTKFIIAKKGGR